MVFEDVHIPGSVVKMFYDSNGLKYAPTRTHTHTHTHTYAHTRAHTHTHTS